MGLEVVGRRVYFSGNTYAVKDRIKSIGAKWDADRRQWWIGSSKKAAAESLVAALDAAPSNSEKQAGERDDARVLAKVEYKGRTYYQTATTRDGQKLRLASLDGKIAFWAAVDACRVVKTYQPREERGAYGRPTGRLVHQTLGGLRRFIERRRGEEADVKAGRIPSGWCLDHEDGIVKPRHECDMPAE